MAGGNSLIADTSRRRMSGWKAGMGTPVPLIGVCMGKSPLGWWGKLLRSQWR
jgi:hypothetical protein